MAHSFAPAAPSRLQMPSVGDIAVALVFMLGGIVFVEPAPFDLAILALAGAFFLFGLRLPGSVFPALLLLCLWITGGLMATPASSFFGETARFVAITGYLAVAAVFIAAYVGHDPTRALPVIFNGYVVGAVIAGLAGIVGYFDLLPGAYDQFTLYGRAKGTFKDPNVFAPFLVPPLLFCMERMFRSPVVQTGIYAAAAAVLALGILISFSRGAWGNAAVSIALALALIAYFERDPAYRLRMTGIVLLSAIIAAVGLLLLVSMTDIASLLAERAQLVQSYDTGGHGRFNGQAHAAGIIVTSPLGIGARDFSAIWGEEVHNVYLNVFLNSGWLGGFAYFALVTATLARLCASLNLPSPLKTYAIVTLASFAGLAAEGVIVDTDHWRHFFILVGIAWGLPAADAWIRARAPRSPTWD